MKAKLSIIHVLASPPFLCLAGCKYFTGFRGQHGPAETPKMGLTEASSFSRSSRPHPGRKGPSPRLGQIGDCAETLTQLALLSLVGT